MAQIVMTTVTCDLEHRKETEGTSTVTFTFDGTAYEIDACDRHSAEIRDVFGSVVKYARPAKAVRRGRAQRPRNRSFTRAVRAWYDGMPADGRKRLGLPPQINNRGRIPVVVVRAYQSTLSEG